MRHNIEYVCVLEREREREREIGLLVVGIDFRGKERLSRLGKQALRL